MNKKSSKSSSLISIQTVIIAAITWAFVSLLVFLLGSPITPRPQWYGVTTYVLENIAFLAASLLCFRNWQSPQIVSGRGVWLLFGLGMMSYFLGNILLGWWELVWGLAPDVSPADLFYLLTYLLLGIGMLLAVVSKRLSLTVIQWITVIAIAVVGAVLAYLISYAGLGSEEVRLPTSPAAVASVSWEQQTGSAAKNDMNHLPVVNQAGQVLLVTTTEPSPAPEPANTPPQDPAQLNEVVPADVDIEAEEVSSAPTWVAALDDSLAPLVGIVGLLYVVGDIFLLVVATMLLLAFWGGRFSWSWRFIAAAAFSFYIADTWFAYAITRIEDYETGALPEVFWIFSAVLLSVGAALEYNLSMRSRRGIRRRT